MTSSPVVHIHSGEEMADILKLGHDEKVPVFVKFGAVWCGPCRVMEPKYKAAAKKYSARALFCTVDIEEVRDVATQFEVRSVPMFCVVKNMTPVETWVGANGVILEQKIAHHIAQQ